MSTVFSNRVKAPQTDKQIKEAKAAWRSSKSRAKLRKSGPVTVVFQRQA